MASNATSGFPFETRPFKPSLVPGISDHHLSLLAPIVVHWLSSACFELCDQTGWLSQHRIHSTAEELTRNRVSRRECLRVTLQCQALQTLLGFALGALGGEEVPSDEDRGLAIVTGRVHAVFATIPRISLVTGVDWKRMAVIISRYRPFHAIIKQLAIDMAYIEAQVGSLLYWYIIPMLQLFIALALADAWMYCLHRLGHTNRWIYKHIHSQHHRLYVPYSWGGSYNHPVDSLVVDGLSYGFGSWVSGLSTRQCILLFSFAAFKNVTDHCGYVFPWNPILSVTGTDPAFHDVHHQTWGLKTNFGVHFSVWDRIMGTHFTDKEQIARLRRKTRAATEKFTSSAEN